jgi:tetratricopeptide (TPR) repeat protein
MPDHCRKCGSPCIEVGSFCDNCGEPLEPGRPPEPISVFYSYSHRDEDLRRELETHLCVLRRSGLIREWHDLKIIAGQDWDKEISKYLESAQIILFLISADFVSSEYIYSVEVRRALAKEKAGDAVVVPVILRPVVWRLIPEFRQFQVLPEGALAVTQWPSHDLAFVNVCEGILALVLSRAFATSDEQRRRLPYASDFRERRKASHGRRRILDCALPGRIPISRPSALLVMIRRTDSPGLSAVVEAEPDYDIGTNDVNRRPLTLEFPIDEHGTPQPLDLSVRIESPQFEPKSQVKSITVPARGDSDPRVFLLTPEKVGPLLVNMEICRGDEIIVGCVLRTLGIASDREELDVPQNITSAALAVSGGGDDGGEEDGGNHDDDMEVVRDELRTLHTRIENIKKQKYKSAIAILDQFKKMNRMQLAMLSPEQYERGIELQGLVDELDDLLNEKEFREKNFQTIGSLQYTCGVIAYYGSDVAVARARFDQAEECQAKDHEGELRTNKEYLHRFADIHYFRALIQKNLGNTNDALSEIDESARSFVDRPTEMVTWLTKAEVMSYVVGREESTKAELADFLEKLAQMERSLKNSGKDLTPNEKRLRIRALLLLGNMFFVSGDFENALGRYIEAVKLCPNDYDALWSSALCYRALGNAETAADSFKACLDAIERPGDLRQNRERITRGEIAVIGAMAARGCGDPTRYERYSRDVRDVLASILDVDGMSPKFFSPTTKRLVGAAELLREMEQAG